MTSEQKIIGVSTSTHARRAASSASGAAALYVRRESTGFWPFSWRLIGTHARMHAL